MQPLLKAAGFNEIHYSGGVTADQYDWQTNTDISQCPGQTMASYTLSCAITDALPFSLLSQHARDLGAQTFATVNYGTGTPALAAAWVAQAAATRRPGRLRLGDRQRELRVLDAGQLARTGSRGLPRLRTE